MTDEAQSPIARPPARRGLTRRGLLRGGFGIVGAVALVVPGGAAYAANEAANQLIASPYRLNPPRWRRGQRLSIAVVADIHAGGRNMGVARVRQVVDATNALQCDLIVLMGDYFATHPFVTERVTPPQWAAELAR